MPDSINISLTWSRQWRQRHRQALKRLIAVRFAPARAPDYRPVESFELASRLH